MRDTNFNQLAIAVIVGTIVWCFGPGAILTYGIAPDWGQLESTHVAKLTDWQAVVALLIASLIFAIAVEATLLVGVYWGWELFILFGPFIMGGWIGALHGLVIGPFWLDILYVYPREPPILITAGAVCSLIGTGIIEFIPIKPSVARA